MRGVLEALDLAWYAGAYRGRDRLRGGFSHYRTLLDDGRENRALLDAGPLPMPVLAVGAGSRGATDPAAPLRPHAADVRGVLAPTGHFVAEEAPDWLVAGSDGSPGDGAVVVAPVDHRYPPWGTWSLTSS